jgi:Fur family transcriptional regulator, ferric uptake regulator
VSHHYKVMQALRDDGIRLTPQRLLVLEILADTPDHLSAEEILNRVRQRYPFVDLSTIYRTLDFLKEYGIVTGTDMGQGRLEFEERRDPLHHHLVCRRCGASQQLGHQFFEPLIHSLFEVFKFQANLDHLVIFGLCAKCQALGNPAQLKDREHVGDG